jgi:CRP-like cAMP-binding protein
MKKIDVSIIKDTVIFRGMTETEITAALEGLNAADKKYRKGATILHAGSTTRCMGLVLEGSVTIENNDVWGNKTILSHVGKNEFFAETYGFLADEPLLVDVVANEDCHILFLTIGSLRRGMSNLKRSPGLNPQLGSGSSSGMSAGMSSELSLGKNSNFSSELMSDAWSVKVVSNLLTISTHKNLALSVRSLHTAPKAIRARVMSYLNSISIQQDATHFDIPFDRQQMADYLNVDRTALSKELRKMKDDGLIDFHKNHFRLKETP